MLYQRTLRHPVHAIGIGVHSGRKTGIGLAPAPAGTGIHFVRADRPGAPSVPGLASYVCDTHLSTSLASGHAKAATVEHLMSALHGMGVDNLRIELNGAEVPALDGSAAPFVDLICSAGIVEQNAPRQYIRIKRKISVADGEARAVLRPYAGFKASYTFADAPAALEHAPRHCEVDLSRVGYAEALSRARTFGRLDDLDGAHDQGKYCGASLENSVGVDELGVLNPEGLRYEDEFAKHRLLDAIGDLYLLGKPLLGAFQGYGSSHALNVALVRELLVRHDAWHVVTSAPPNVVVHEPAMMAAALGA